MKCETHGNVDLVVHGKCGHCLKDETLNLLDDVAHKRVEVELCSGAEPFCYACMFQIYAKDLPWLSDKALDASHVKTLRSLLSHSYLLDFAHRLQDPRTFEDYIGAAVMLGLAMDFQPEERWVWWEIHYGFATLQQGILNMRGDLSKAAFSDDTKVSLASVAVHLDLALRHLRHAMKYEGYTPGRDEHDFATNLLREILECSFFAMTCGVVVGVHPIGKAPYREFLFAGSREGPGID